MKATLAVCSMLVSFATFAQGEKPCRVYEFAELNTYSDAELGILHAKYSEILSSIKGAGMPSNPRDLREYFDDTRNCTQETERISRLIESRKRAAAEAEVKKPESKKR